MFKTSMTVLPYGIVRFLDLALKNEKQNILSDSYILWMRGIGSRVKSATKFKGIQY